MMVSIVTAIASTRNARPKIDAARDSSFFTVAASGRALFHADERTDGLLPAFRAAGIDLVAGLGPGRIGNVAHGGFHDLQVGRQHRNSGEAELLAGGAWVHAGVAVHRVIPQRLGIDPDIVGELL